jgi:hypothetical protein
LGKIRSQMQILFLARIIHFLNKYRDHEQLRIDGDFYPCAV